MSSLGSESVGRLTPQLARLQEMERLYELAHDKGPEARTKLGEAMANLFAATDLSVREQEIIADIMITMLRQAEMDLRQAIADRLAMVDQTPLRVILYLSNDDISVARPILSKSRVLEDVDLVYLVQTQSSDYWQAIASRAELRPPVVRALVDTHDTPTAGVLVRNPGAEIPEDCYKVLAEMAAVATDLRAPLLQRKDIPKDLVARIYSYTASKIEKELRTVAPIIEPVTSHIADVAVEMISAAHDDYTPTDIMMQAARTLQSRGQLTIDNMMKTLKLGQMASFMAQMSVFSDIPVEQVQVFMQETTGETLAAICRVRRVDRKVFLRFFLLTNKLRSDDRMVDPQYLNEALKRFDQLSIEKCNAIINHHRSLH